MPRKTQATRAEELGITAHVLRQAKAAGVNIWADAAMAKWLKKLKPKKLAKRKLAKRKVAKKAAKKVAKKKPAKKRVGMTQVERAEELGVTRNVIQNARNAGVDIWDDEGMRVWLDGRRVRVNPKARVPVQTELELPGVTIEDLELEVKGAETYDEVKILKEKISALLQAQKVRKEERDLIPMKEAKEAVLRIVAGLKGRLLKVPSDTAPRVEGLNAAKVEKVIRAEMLAALEDLANDGHGIFENV